jgi:hypothetical protein
VLINKHEKNLEERDVAMGLKQLPFFKEEVL